MVSALCADDPNERKPGLSEPLLPPSQPPSESPSLSTQPPVAPPPSNMPAGINTTLNYATSSASQPLQLPPNPAEKPAAPAQIPLQEQQPQLRPLSGAALAATAPSARGQPQVFSKYDDTQAASANTLQRAQCTAASCVMCPCCRSTVFLPAADCNSS